MLYFTEREKIRYRRYGSYDYGDKLAMSAPCPL